MKVNWQDSIKFHEYQKQKSKSKLANFHGKIEKTNMKRGKILWKRQKNQSKYLNSISKEPKSIEIDKIPEKIMENQLKSINAKRKKVQKEITKVR